MTSTSLVYAQAQVGLCAKWSGVTRPAPTEGVILGLALSPSNDVTTGLRAGCVDPHGFRQVFRACMFGRPWQAWLCVNWSCQPACAEHGPHLEASGEDPWGRKKFDTASWTLHLSPTARVWTPLSTARRKARRRQALGVEARVAMGIFDCVPSCFGGPPASAAQKGPQDVDRPPMALKYAMSKGTSAGGAGRSGLAFHSTPTALHARSRQPPARLPSSPPASSIAHSGWLSPPTRHVSARRLARRPRLPADRHTSLQAGPSSSPLTSPAH